VVKKFGDDGAGQLAALVAYYGFFSMFPLLLALTTVLGFALSGNPDLQESILDSALSQFPVIGDQIQENVGSLDGSGIALMIGLAGAVWAGFGALDAVEHAMNTVWDVPRKERPNFFERRLRGALMLVIVGAALIAATVLGSAGGFGTGRGLLGRVAPLAGSFVVATAMLLVAFQVLTDRPTSWRSMLPGALFGGVGFTVLQFLGGLYVRHAVQGASETYGLFAVVIGLLSWIYLLAQVLLAAAEINVVAEGTLWPRSLSGEDLTTADKRVLARLAKVEERRHDEHVDTELTDGNQREPITPDHDQ
jgi:inner membrane protein YhjD